MDDKEMEKIRREKMEELIRKQSEPKTKAKEFARAILECKKYKNFIKYNEELQKNQTAQNLLTQFQQKQMELQWSGFNSDILEELKKLQMKISKENTLKGFLNSQQELLGLLRRTNDLISEKIGQQFAQSGRRGCC